MAYVLSVASFNIHKGFSPFNARLTVHELRERLRSLAPDIVFLQEVQGAHSGHAARHGNWPAAAQHDFLAEDVWPDAAYGRNVVHGRGHHGNAILSRFPIEYAHNQDVTHLRFERRGLLHCTLRLPTAENAERTTTPTPHRAGPPAIAQLPPALAPAGELLHCVCVHLSLFAHSRRRQMSALADYLESAIDADAPLIIAGDFNDWRNDGERMLARRLGLGEVFSSRGRPARSFPARLPLLRLDRIYVRGFSVEQAGLQFVETGLRVSDHAALSAHLRRADKAGAHHGD
ncbi:endonuclease/exonuclease/phosphatase family protein [Rhodocyclus tenuis]|uniref:Endonuclease/exonuclease/phosphatase family metal-dependent hydrolase n=1 Tax=Rhodocyclus tenuis TaxID=1066 RepID=A0A840G2S5_RHOTE|nr:endonuclease/exonuclease/phosphatase family protein [Rhodocyclus tenuis]MBB4246256.1 endonuclease/exonuclease/phosphatase family metal-dependent hydrolase [Rhodocyclus tenuis]